MHGMLTSVRSNAKSVVDDIQLCFQRLHSVLQARYAKQLNTFKLIIDIFLVGFLSALCSIQI